MLVDSKICGAAYKGLMAAKTSPSFAETWETTVAIS